MHRNLQHKRHAGPRCIGQCRRGRLAYRAHAASRRVPKEPAAATTKEKRRLFTGASYHMHANGHKPAQVARNLTWPAKNSSRAVLLDGHETVTVIVTANVKV